MLQHPGCPTPSSFKQSRPTTLVRALVFAAVELLLAAWCTVGHQGLEKVEAIHLKAPVSQGGLAFGRFLQQPRTEATLEACAANNSMLQEPLAGDIRASMSLSTDSLGTKASQLPTNRHNPQPVRGACNNQRHQRNRRVPWLCYAIYRPTAGLKSSAASFQTHLLQNGLGLGGGLGGDPLRTQKQGGFRRSRLQAGPAGGCGRVIQGTRLNAPCPPAEGTESPTFFGLGLSL